MKTTLALFLCLTALSAHAEKRHESDIPSEADTMRTELSKWPATHQSKAYGTSRVLALEYPELRALGDCLGSTPCSDERLGDLWNALQAVDEELTKGTDGRI